MTRSNVVPLAPRIAARDRHSYYRGEAQRYTRLADNATDLAAAQRYRWMAGRCFAMADACLSDALRRSLQVCNQPGGRSE